MILLTMVLTKYVLINSIIEFVYFTNFQFVFLSTSVILITAAGYIINDIFDIETDKINKPKSVLIQNSINIKTATFSYIAFTLVGFILAVYLCYINNSFNLISVYIFSILSLFFYSYYFKKKALIGNVLISTLCSLPIILTFLFHTNYKTKNVGDGILLYYTVVTYSIFSFLTTLIREISKDIEDINGDLKIKAKTLPIIIGRKRASKVAFFFSCILLIFLLITLNFNKNNALFLIYGIVLLLFPLLFFMFRLYLAETKKDFSKLSSIMKAIMFFGILSMILFKFM
ncbi:geranylgeranylglycerol-phosphate geranylgeranyltransferase [Polaribacter sargassicola]|uniref:geranylgeranylglycerol-phosphate geranylgeranyltransferase n=1 Tax=Polaribacter sargassicola TaxID=2836891 RepID=UPI001F39237C|nr:geranylgeranylglycerol-phosphate geranylgeranyltransferase [Polaribacter sp. DS7-9]MCG1036902.1 geranylgeranylglycerol-phosphate geranylgeranyltransferase [Polaribacter sp. DS7-9]